VITRPDWRWARVLDLFQRTFHDRQARLKKEDAQTVRAFKGKEAFDNRHPVVQDLPIHESIQIFSNNIEYRAFIEGLLLAGANDNEIAELLEIDPTTATVYNDTFFDVRSRLTKPAALCALVFHGMPQAGCAPEDRIGLTHRIAYLGGLTLFKDVICGNISSGELSSMYVNITKKLLSQRSVETALTFNQRSEHAPEFLKFTISEDAKSKNDDDGTGDLAKIAKAVIGKLSVSVADPTDESNVSEAKELRSHEYQVT
jgi:hypothetical protein